jgi:O-acetyl-ADP-ribose deacetylase (regulator of RNase III)
VIEYRVGDVTATAERPVILVHVCNDVGRFGRGVAAAIAARWPAVRGEFLWWSRATPAADRLGQVLFVDAEPGVLVANMVAQRGLPSASNRRPLDLATLDICLQSVALVARGDTMGPVVVMPKIGTGHGGTPWNEVEPLVTRTLDDLPIVVYDLPKETAARARRVPQAQRRP